MGRIQFASSLFASACAAVLFVGCAPKDTAEPGTAPPVATTEGDGHVEGDSHSHGDAPHGGTLAD